MVVSARRALHGAGGGGDVARLQPLEPLRLGTEPELLGADRRAENVLRDAVLRRKRQRPVRLVVAELRDGEREGRRRRVVRRRAVAVTAATATTRD